MMPSIFPCGSKTCKPRRGGDVEVAVGIDRQTIAAAAGAGRAFTLLERAEDAPLAELAGRLDGVGHHFLLPAGNHVERFLVDGENHAVGRRQVVRQPRDLAVRGAVVDRILVLRSRVRGAERRVSEVHAPRLIQDQVVGCVKAFALVRRCHGRGLLAGNVDRDDAAVHLARVQLALAINHQAVGVIRRLQEHRDLARRVEPVDAIGRNIAEVEIAAAVAGRSFRELEFALYLDYFARRANAGYLLCRPRVPDARDKDQCNQPVSDSLLPHGERLLLVMKPFGTKSRALV